MYVKADIDNFIQLANINPTFFPVVQDKLRSHPTMSHGVNGSTVLIIQSIPVCISKPTS